MKKLIALDFDECLIDGHLSKNMTQAFLSEHLVEAVDFGHTEKALAALLQIYIGRPRSYLQDLAKASSDSVTWRRGAYEFLRSLQARPQMECIILSSGLDLPLRCFLEKQGCAVHVQSCRLHWQDGLCSGIAQIVCHDEKARQVQNAVKRYGPGNVYVVGHGPGDLAMMSIARSACIPKGYAPAEEIAEISASDFTRLAEWIEF